MPKTTPTLDLPAAMDSGSPASVYKASARLPAEDLLVVLRLQISSNVPLSHSARILLNRLRVATPPDRPHPECLKLLREAAQHKAFDWVCALSVHIRSYPWPSDGGILAEMLSVTITSNHSSEDWSNLLRATRISKIDSETWARLIMFGNRELAQKALSVGQSHPRQTDVFNAILMARHIDQPTLCLLLSPGSSDEILAKLAHEITDLASPHGLMMMHKLDAILPMTSLWSSPRPDLSPDLSRALSLVSSRLSESRPSFCSIESLLSRWGLEDATALATPDPSRKKM